MTHFFDQCKNLDELKAAYKAAAKKYHPDMGGDTATMQAVNAEYDARFEVLKRSQNTQAAEDTTGKTHATTENAADFRNIIDLLLHLDGLEVELCGRWLWISGNTREHKDALKEAGCRWCSSKKLWSWHFQEEGVPYHKGGRKYSMGYIRNKYGSETFTRSADRAEAITA